MANILQLKITLNDSRPPIWRRIQIADTSTFFDLHNVIQDAMGWEDYHLHNFAFAANRAKNPIIIGPQDEDSMYEKLPEDKEILKDWLGKRFEKCRYTYDYGDNWEHAALLEKTLPVEPGIKYPRCLDGKRACPPEDSGGLWGYYSKLEILQDPKHKEYNDTQEWMGKYFDPETFDPVTVVFRR